MNYSVATTVIGRWPSPSACARFSRRSAAGRSLPSLHVASRRPSKIQDPPASSVCCPRPFICPPRSGYSHYTRLFDNATLHRLLQPAVREYFWLEWDRIATHMDAAIESAGPVAKAAMAADKLFYLPDDLLVKIDRASMQFALEVRSPFLDPALVTFAAGLSGARTFAMKRLLSPSFRGRSARRSFPSSQNGFRPPDRRVVSHQPPPTCFATRSTRLPIRSLTRFSSGPVIEELIEDHESRRARSHSTRLYAALLQLELWAQNRPLLQ